MNTNPAVANPHYSRSFSSATAAQRAAFDAALAAASFQWLRLGIPVHVYFTDDPAPTEHFEVAWTTYFPNTNTALNDFSNEHAEVRIANGLLDPQHRFYEGVEFFNEVVVHEMSHVLVAQLDPNLADFICGMFGAPASAWNPPVTDQASWKNRVIESVCETFKDLYLPRASRKYDNRTNWRLRPDRLQDFLDVIATVFDVQRSSRAGNEIWTALTPFTKADGKTYVGIAMVQPEIGGDDTVHTSTRFVSDFLVVVDHRLGTRTADGDPVDFALADWGLKYQLIDFTTGTNHVLIDAHNPGFELHTVNFAPAGNEGPPYTWIVSAEGDVPYITIDEPPLSPVSMDRFIHNQSATIFWIEETPGQVFLRPSWPYQQPTMAVAKSPVGTIRRGYRGP